MLEVSAGALRFEFVAYEGRQRAGAFLAPFPERGSVLAHQREGIAAFGCSAERTAPTHDTSPLHDVAHDYAPPAVAGVPDPQTQYSYSLDDQVETTSLPQSSDITFNYDATTGKLDTAVMPEATYIFVYDDEGDADDTGQLTSVSIDPVAAGAATNTLTYC